MKSIETIKGEFIVMDLPTIEEIEKEIEIYGHDEGLTTVDESELEFKNGNHYYKKYKVEYIIRNS